MTKLSFTMENYLEAIYELSGDEKGARVSDIAERLNVTKASTNSAMSTLAEKGLIVNEKYGEIFLTAAGRSQAEFTSKKHHIIRKFFIDILKIDVDTADSDACAIEHVISSKSIEAMQEFLCEDSVKIKNNFHILH
jgi:Mn-dependent DtxR family transcriptional regulator